jgi:signal transduction histidine kinase
MEARLPGVVEIGLYRIVQEAITNIVRHAQATNATIELTRVADRIEILVTDDGRGFDVPAQWRAQPGGRGLGILGMQERVAVLGGEFGIESAPGRGTSVRASVPLEEDAVS